MVPPPLVTEAIADGVKGLWVVETAVVGVQVTVVAAGLIVTFRVACGAGS
jgi:hypothetical protein